MKITVATLLGIILMMSTNVLAQNLDYGAYGLFPQGSSRAMGMGGAYTGLSDDVTGMIFNPAGLALGNWKIDLGSTQNAIDNREVEQSPGNYFGIPYSFTFYAAAFRLGSWVIGAGYSQPYSVDQKDSNSEKNLTITSADVVLAKSFFKKFSIGVTAHYEEATLSYKEVLSIVDEEDMVSAEYYTYGVLFKHKKLKIGYSFTPRREYQMDKTKNNNIRNGEIWFRNISIASKSSVGFSYWVKNDVLLVADIDTYEAVPNTMFVGTGEFDDFSASLMVNNKHKVLHGGLEWYLTKSNSNEVIWRLGGYNEPSRLINGSARTHFTMGLQVRFGPAILSVAFDNAREFKNTSAGFSLSFGKI